MLDHAFGIFNNLSPRFQWAEIDLPFPSDDVYFKVANYDELVAQSLYPQHKMKIKDAFLVLFSRPETAEEDLRVLRAGNLTALDMQMLIHCKFLSPTSYLLGTNVLPRSVYVRLEKHILKPDGRSDNQRPRSVIALQNCYAELANRLGPNQKLGTRERVEQTWFPENRGDIFRCREGDYRCVREKGWKVPACTE
jgi:hypothetical protein